MTERKYFWNGCRKNKILFLSIDESMIETMNDAFNGPMKINYMSNGLSGLLLDDQ